MTESRSFNILYITSVDLSLERGPGINEREFLLGLNKNPNCEVISLIPKPRKKFQELEYIRNNLYLSKPNSFYNPFTFLAHVVSQVSNFYAISRNHNYHLIVFRLDIFPLAPFLISLISNQPYAIKTLEYFDYFKYQKGLKGLLGKLTNPLSSYMHRKITKRAVAIDVCTEAFVDFFHQRLKINKEKLHYIDNAVNVSRFKIINTSRARERTNLSCFQNIVGFVGGRPLERGGLQILEAAPELIKKLKSIGFVVVGGSMEENDVMKTIAMESGIIDFCIFPGKVAYDEVVYYINSFDVCISFDLESRTAIFGNASQKIRQYIACGKPVITGEGGNELIEEEGLGSIVKDYNTKNLVAAIVKWLCTSESEKREHAFYAANYAKSNLSMDIAIEKRLSLWFEGIYAG